MRSLLLAAFLLGGCGALDAFENSRSPEEAFYLLKKKEDDKSLNPYDNNPKYRAVYCLVDGIEFRSTVSACAKAKGKARLTN
jgi:hypothetical protein